MSSTCDMPTCNERACMLLIAKPSGTGKDSHLDFRACLEHGIELRAAGYREAPELVEAFDE